MTKGKVIFVRCGESMFNKHGLFTGWYDSPLTEKGKRQAVEVAAQKLLAKGIKFDYVYTSVLNRSIETADIIVSEMKYSYMCIERDWRLNNRHYGQLTSYKKADLAKTCGLNKVKSWQRGFYERPSPILCSNHAYSSICNNSNLSVVPKHIFPLTESLYDVQKRALQAWETNIFPKVQDGKIVLVVTHGAVIRALRQYIEQLPEDVLSETNIPHCVPYIYNFTPGDVNGKLKIALKILASKDYMLRETSNTDDSTDLSLYVD